MKKFAAIISAVLLSVLISVTAGARTKTIVDYNLVYDFCYDWYWIIDPATGTTAGIRYVDGAIDWFSGYPEEIDESTDGSISYSDYEQDTWWYEKPVVENYSTEVGKVDLVCRISSDWKADFCSVMRKASNETKWTEVTNSSVKNNNDYCEIDYYSSTPSSDTITYRFVFYKDFTEGRLEVTSAEITVEGKGDLAGYEDVAPPTITSSRAVAKDVRLYCSLPLEWNVEDYSVERRTASTDWEQIGTGYVRNYGKQYEVWYNDTQGPSEGTVYYRINFYRYTLGNNGWCQFLATSAEIALEIKPDYPEPKLTKTEIGDTVVDFELSADNRWEATKCVVNRRTSETGAWKKVGNMTKQSGSSKTVFTYTDSKLTQKTQYYYQFELYSAAGKLLTTVETGITTAATPEKPKMLSPIAHSDRITLTVEADSLWKADGFEVLRYSNKKKKWEKLFESESFGTSDRKDGSFLTATYTNTGLKASTTYKYKVKLYREVNGKREYFSTLSKSVKTLMPAPKLTVGATSKTAKLSWSKVSGADGYEVYVLPMDKGDYSTWMNFFFKDIEGYTTAPQYDKYLEYYNQSYSSSSVTQRKISDFTKKTTVKGKTSTSFTIKSSKVYIYIVRAYKKSGSTKLYSDFSNQQSTDTTSALLNGLTLKSKVTVSASDVKLIKAALSKCTNSKMSNAEKAAAIYGYVNNAAIYETDYSKIPADPVEAILSAGRGQCYQFAATYQAMMKYIGFDVKLVSGKNSSGNPHWWCQLNCAGTDYMIDPQVGGRFLITYESLDMYAVTPEKVYD